MIKIFAAILAHILRRGHGIFKLLFVIDDFIRLFAMTFVFGAFSWLIQASSWITVPAVILGLVIDMHDFMTENKLLRKD